ncbi:EAL domain-containing protein [Melghiribacillus thermohalophilus]|uniref:EAL domain-containing protein n=1 Tax=Melghiribacillus thermohalophilus TaxID=1324956 RepID=UPI001047F66A|nr:EAL-associated domain-containing protein [Melghiribacillus thermohalophilus]
MDALDILMNLKNTRPYYQPIISADSHNIYGYEVLGRIKTEQGVKSLGSFFHDSHVPNEYKREVDEHLVKIALEEFLSHNQDAALFLNINPNIIMEDTGERFVRMLSSYQDQGLRLDQIVIEITEHEYRGDISRLAHLIRYLQTLGIKIALDDVAKGSSNLDRIGILEPDLFKIDIHSLNYNEKTISHHGVLYSLSHLARKIGADLIFQGIETVHQLHDSLRQHGRYFQGYFLAGPERSFLPVDHFKDRFREAVHQFILHERTKIQRRYNLANELNNRIHLALKETKKQTNLDNWMVAIAHQISDCCFRIYICDQDGFQQTSNGVLQKDKWVLHSEYKGKNWSWRPYFMENIFRMNDEQKGILSDIYSDIETGELIRTFSYPLNTRLYLFMDLPHSFLYEHDIIAW